jgi:hypothetical protein
VRVWGSELTKVGLVSFVVHIGPLHHTNVTAENVSKATDGTKLTVYTRHNRDKRQCLLQVFLI